MKAESEGFLHCRPPRLAVMDAGACAGRGDVSSRRLRPAHGKGKGAIPRASFFVMAADPFLLDLLWPLRIFGLIRY